MTCIVSVQLTVNVIFSVFVTLIVSYFVSFTTCVLLKVSYQKHGDEGIPDIAEDIDSMVVNCDVDISNTAVDIGSIVVTSGIAKTKIYYVQSSLSS